MSREAISITVTSSLRRAQIRQRLDTLAGRTALPPTQIAGRALTIGLALIETDLTRLFPDEAAPSNAAPAMEQPCAEQHSRAKDVQAPTCHALPGIDTQRADAAPRPLLVPEPDSKPRFISTANAARELGYRAESAFRQHCQRHPEIKKLSKRQGRSRLWDLAKLRALYAGQSWQPK